MVCKAFPIILVIVAIKFKIIGKGIVLSNPIGGPKPKLPVLTYYLSIHFSAFQSFIGPIREANKCFPNRIIGKDAFGSSAPIPSLSVLGEIIDMRIFKSFRKLNVGILLLGPI